MTDIVLPTDQTEGTSNVVGKWFKAVGDPVSLNEPLLEITTDKVTVEIAAPVAGVLTEILKPEGESVEPGDVVGRIDSNVTLSQAKGVSTPSSAPSVSSTLQVDPRGESELSPAV